MLLRQLRWIAAGLAVVAAVCASPARSKADVQILVEELDGSKNVFASGSFAVGNPGGPNTFFQNFNYSSGSGHFTLTGSTGTNSHQGTLNASLSTSFTAGFTSNFNPAQNHSLRITVTDDEFASNGQPATLTNTAGVSSGFAGGTIQVDSFSRIYNPGAGGSTSAGSNSVLASGTTIGGPTPVATDIRPDTQGVSPTTAAPVAGLPSPYAIQQVILVSVNQTTGIDRSSTFGGTAGARVDPTVAPPRAVPAPAGLVLGLIALPLVGLRRTLRSRTAA